MWHKDPSHTSTFRSFHITVTITDHARACRIDIVSCNSPLQQQGTRLTAQAVALAGMMRAIKDVREVDTMLSKHAPKIAMDGLHILMTIQSKTYSALVGDHHQQDTSGLGALKSDRYIGQDLEVVQAPGMLAPFTVQHPITVKEKGGPAHVHSPMDRCR